MQGRREMDETNEIDGTNLMDEIKEDRVAGHGTMMKNQGVRRRVGKMMLRGARAVRRVVLRVKMIAQRVKMIEKIGTEKKRGKGRKALQVNLRMTQKS